MAAPTHLEATPPDVRTDLRPKDFDGLSSTFSKEEKAVHPVMGSIDAEVAALAVQDWEAVVITPAEDKRLHRLVVKRVLTVMLGTYLLQSLDKGTMSFAAIMNIQEDTGMVGQDFAWLTTILYLGVLVMEWPVSIFVQRLPVGRYLACCVIAWGAVLASSAASSSWAGFMVCRFLLGALECAIQPCLLVMTSMWFRREEQAQTISLWYAMTGLQQAIGGVMSFGVSYIKNAPVKSWQVLFIGLGCFTVLWGLFILWWLPDSPMRAKCFSEEDRTLLLERVRRNQTGVQNKTWKREQVVEALKDPQVWALCLMQVLNTTPTGGYGTFGNIIIDSFGYDVLQTSLLSIAQGAVEIAIALSCAYVAQRYKQTIGVALACVVPSVAATIVMMTVQSNSHNKAGLLVAFYSGFFFNGQAIMIFSLISRNIGGQTKKTFTIALTFVAWCTGNMIGPQVFQSNDAPRYRKGFSVHLAFYGCEVLTLVALRIYLVRQNKLKAERRIAKFGVEAEETENLDEAFSDLTDRENDQFRYVI